MIEDDMAIQINSRQAAVFKRHFESSTFTEEERGYKWAVHLLVSGLLSERFIGSESFPGLLAKLMTGKLTPQDVGLASSKADAVEGGLRNVDGGLYGALSMLYCCDGYTRAKIGAKKKLTSRRKKR